MDLPGAAACNPRALCRSARPKRQTMWSCRDVYSHELRPPHTRDPVAASAAYAQVPGTDFSHSLTAPGRCRKGSNHESPTEPSVLTISVTAKGQTATEHFNHEEILDSCEAVDAPA